MMNRDTKVSELTVGDLLNLMRSAVREALEEQAGHSPRQQRKLLDIPPLSVGAWPEGLKLISREEYYGDDGR